MTRGIPRFSVELSIKHADRGKRPDLRRGPPLCVQDLLPEPERFARKVKITRHYHAHWSADPRAEAATTLGELDGLAKAFRCVLEALLLLELGFTVEEADGLLERNLNYRRELSRGLEAANSHRRRRQLTEFGFGA